MLKRKEPSYKPPFELIDFFVNVEHRDRRGTFAEATVKVSVDGEILHTAAEGNGPVNALDHRLAQGAAAALTPRLATFHLADYKVRILDGENGHRGDHPGADRHQQQRTSAGARWAPAANIIEASWMALADSVEYGLMVAD